MRKFFLLLFSIFTLSNLSVLSSEPKNPVLEYCTGTWCPTCPCAHRVVRDSILMQHPNSIIISYHGQPTSSDPFRNFNGNQILSMMGFVSYASGVANRTSSPRARTFWVNDINNVSLDTATVNISITKSYDISLRELTATISLKALGDLHGSYYVNFILTEDSLLTTQNGNASCIGGTNYRLDHVVRDMINSPNGELINSNPWQFNQIHTKNLSYVLSPQVRPYNSFLIVLVYKDNGGAFNMNTIQQAVKVRVSDVPVGIISNNHTIYENYFLNQNFPNPFNPSTAINYNILARGSVSLEVYDIIGEHITTLVSQTQSAGNYTVSFNGDNLSSGIYYYKLFVSDENTSNIIYQAIRKMIFIK